MIQPHPAQILLLLPSSDWQGSLARNRSFKTGLHDPHIKGTEKQLQLKVGGSIRCSSSFHHDYTPATTSWPCPGWCPGSCSLSPACSPQHTQHMSEITQSSSNEALFLSLPNVGGQNLIPGSGGTLYLRRAPRSGSSSF